MQFIDVTPFIGSELDDYNPFTEEGASRMNRALDLCNMSLYTSIQINRITDGV